MQTYMNHQASELFPMMTEDEMKGLAENIKERGLLEPIVLCEGMILDGRNRYAACAMAGVEAGTIPWNGEHGTPVQYVMAKNFHRRQLSQSQRIAIAAKSATMMQPVVPKNAKAETDVIENIKNSTSLPIGSEVSEGVVAVAAEAMKVSPRSVRRALHVMHEAPEKFEQIIKDEKSVHQAYQEVTTPPPGKRDTMIQNSAKRRIYDALTQIECGCGGLAAANMEAALASSTKEDRKFWRQAILDRAKELRVFRRRIGGDR